MPDNPYRRSPASTPETKFVGVLSEGLSSRHIDTQRVARLLTILPTSTQVQIAEIVWHLIGVWSERTIPPGNAMEPNIRLAERIVGMLRNPAGTP